MSTNEVLVIAVDGNDGGDGGGGGAAAKAATDVSVDNVNGGVSPVGKRLKIHHNTSPGTNGIPLGGKTTNKEIVADVTGEPTACHSANISTGDDDAVSTENQKKKDDVDASSGNNERLLLVPQLAEYGITESDLRVATRVLEAVGASLNPRKRKRNGTKSQHSRKKQGKQPQQRPNQSDSGHDRSSNPAEDGEVDNGAKDYGNNSNNHKEEEEEEDLLAQYQQPNLRPLRKALASCYEIHKQIVYNGLSEQDHYTKRLSERTLKRHKMAERTQQRKYIADTELRRGRVQRLERLKEEAKEEEEARIMRFMIPDGHVDTTLRTNECLLLKNDDEETTAGTTTTTRKITETMKEKSRQQSEGVCESMETSEEQDTSDNIHDNANKCKDHKTNNPSIQLPRLRSCYVCKVRYRDLHHFYDQLCPTCAAINYTKRHQTSNLFGKIAIVTGSRVKIGYQTCLKLLRAGATVIATTRFPNSAAATYRSEHDFDVWKERLHIYGLDLRDVTGLEAFTRFLKVRYGTVGVDILINNACQTVRRPTGYYRPAVEKEQELWATGDDVHRRLLSGCVEFERVRRRLLLDHLKARENGQETLPQIGEDKSTARDVPLLQMAMGGSGTEEPDGTVASAAAAEKGNATEETVLTTSSPSQATTLSPANVNTPTPVPFETTGLSYSAAMSQMIVLPEDVGVSSSILPAGMSDVHGQQLDLRTKNSWLLKMDEVSTPEIMECMFVNAIAPFVLNSRLKPLMTTPNNGNRPDRFIINVSAMEGKFYRYKMPNHPHTNMAKAALNMLTRTSAEDLARNFRIYMNSVDTGWINDENPLEKASKIAKTNLFQTPIDEIDAAARILDPIFTGVGIIEGDDSGGHKKEANSSTTEKVYGKFFKDYKETEW